ncbi:amino acid adenylation domain-containing protein, partial [Erwinia amylovora]|uniref:amino acid adenylation domain-containing protein n=1 Tax=Erwinia amylovora TaxID=552 RepID=UPI0039BCF6EC
VTRSAPDFVRLVCEHGVTVLNQTPSAFRAFARAEADSGLSHQLRWVIFGGEALETASLGEWYQRHAEDAPQLVNMYGITETTVHVTWHLLTRADTELTHSPVGRRIADLRLYLLDEQQQPVPTGASGELYVGGAGVARGYLNRPELSAERFLPDPFSPLPGARMYRAGDLARFHNDGSLIYLGRNDDQVKIRGFRIEPGEIAACLGEHPEVREAAVIARTQHGEPQLLAYVVTQQPLEDLASVLRTFLADRLPAYMIPAAYIALAQLPLTANGKLDRRALPEPDDSAFARSAFAAPQGEIEQALAAIWQQLLNVERVSRFDNFFALGGHSLLAVQLMERLRRRQLPASVQAVFTTRTLAELAATLGQQQEVSVPPLLIGRDCGQITPEMLPLISLSQEEIDSLTARLPGGVAAIQDIYGLSPLQEGILFHHLMSDKGDPYLLIAQLRFDDRAALLRYAAALDRVVARHDVLRTAFVWEGLSEPAQLVLRQVDTVLTELELDDNAPALQQLLARFHPRHYRLDLGQAPLLRLIAARDGDGSWYAVQLWHHLIGDHAALAIQQEEIVAFCSGHADSLPPPTPYRNLIAQARLGVSQQEHEQFFRSMLGDIDTPTLPFGLSDVHANGQGVREAHLALPDALSRGLREQARQLGVSLASLCHLAWGQVLAHTSGNDKVVFGTVLLGRLQAGPEAERILGLVINTLPLRLDIDQRGTREAVQETHAALSRLLGHEHASLTLAQRCSGIAAPAPLFSALLNYRHNQESDGSLPMPAGTTLLSGEERTNYPFVMAVDDDGQSLGLSAQMTAGIAPEHACGWMAQALTSLLAALEKEPQSPVRQLCVVPAAERTLLLETLNQSSQPYPADRCLHDEFEMQAAADPQAIALTCGEQRISYGELNARANQLAHYLMEAGVGPDRRVALCVSRSPSMIVALLAILKAGGAYVPLDPSYPADRLAYIIEDARPVMLLHDAAGREALGEVDIPALSLDNRLPESWPQDNPQRRQATLTAQHLAYILYTSGSTGKPKGVMLDHAAVQCRLDWMRQTYGFCADDVFLQKTTFNFDLSVWEIFCSLQCGAQLALASDADVKDPQRMADLVTREKVTIAQFVPSTLAPFLATQSPDNASPLRLVIFGGEALTPEHLKQCQSVLPRVAFRNMYGPTEAAIDALFWPCPDNYDGSQIAIGRPMAWTAAYVLDEQGDPVPFGAVGELYLGGAGVARGYLNRAELTAERFLDDPFSPLPGARMYRTGDLARYQNDGSLIYLGRNDDQVKIRGFRIEPGEIAARLSEHPDVREAAVTAQQRPGAEPRLVAYVVPLRTDNAPAAAALRTFLAGRLPDYMLPAAWLTLDALPLTPNGKLDRRALPVPDDDAFARADFEAPQGDTEQLLANLWSELLGVSRIGRRDDFFALGGHSLLAVRLSGRLRQLHHGALTVQQIFTHPLLAEMAAAVSAAPRDALPAFIRADRDRPLPLSFAQQRLWFLWQLEEDPATYNMPAAVTLHGNLDAGALHLALGDLFARHEAWRMTFSEQDGQPFARLLPPDAAPPLVHHDLRDHANHQAQLQRLCAEEAHQPFSLSRGPLVRARLVRLPDDRCCLLVTQHHIVSDGWSVGVMWRELSACYNARRAGSTAVLPPLPLQFPDYAAWQRRFLTPERLSQQADYWYQQLHGAPDLLPLPTDRPRPPQQSYLGAAAPVDFGAEFSAALRRFSRRHGVTPYMTVLAAWSVVLGRLAGCDDLVIGTPVAGRDRAELEPMVGFLVNTLALRIRPQHDTSVADLLARVRQQVLDGQANQELPFEQVVERLNPPRQLAHAPLFQVLLAWQTAPAQPELDGLQVSPAPDAYARIKFDLELSLVDDAHGIHGALRYATALFDAATAQRHAGYLLNVLQAMLAEPQLPLARLPVLGEEERQQLLLTSNLTPAGRDTRCLHQHFEQHAARRPHAVALAWDGGTLTYGELNARANRLAHRLLAEGVQPDQLVALCADRSPQLTIGLLAILKAGAAYLPLDPAYAGERLAYILDDARPALLLADEAGRTALGDTGLNTIALDSTDDDGWPAENPHCAVAPHHLAYVIYTSGSTGQPKGVMVEHRQVDRLFHATAPTFGFSERDTWCLFHSFSFDFSVWEIWGAWCYGGRLVIVPAAVTRSAPDFVRLVCEHGVTVLNQTPSAFRAFARAEADSGLSHQLRWVIFGGEALETASLGEWYQRHAEDAPQLVNMYGITETTVHVTWHLLTRADTELTHSPVGRRVADLRLYLLDEQQQPVPAGASGELYVGGAGVARGYLNRPELSAERFLPDPFSPLPGARMYRAGDLARYLPDGSLAYLGRNDDQVKIRGFRIEPGEIAARLGEHPAVREAAVIARTQHGEPQLVAYVTLHQPCDALAETLRDHLQTRLPAYMIPAAYIALAQLPLTANGKLDRRALPGPDDSAFARSAFEAPQGEVEQALAAIWQQLLNVERVSRFDNFFALGGHSLLAVRLMERLRRRQLPASVQAVFTTRTLAELAATLGQQQEVSVPPLLIGRDCRQITPQMLPLISLSQEEIDSLTARLPGGVAAIQDIYGLSPLQEGILFHHLMSDKGDPYLLIAQLRFDDRAALLRYAAALDRVVARHDVLRTAFVWQGLSEPAQLVLREVDSVLTELELDDSAPAPEQLLARFHPRHYRLDLGQAPLLRLIAARGDDGRWYAVQLWHHLIGDHTALAIQQEEIAAICEGRGDSLTPPAPYRNLVAHARLGISQRAQEDFFSAMLGDIDTPTLPFGLSDVHADGQGVREAHLALPDALSRGLREQARQLGVSLASLCHLAWGQVLAHTSGNQQVVFGTVLLGRLQAGPEADRILGLFVNTLPLRLDIDQRGTREAVQETHAALSRLLGHEHASLALAQRCSGIAAPAPLFSALLNYRHNDTDVTQPLIDGVDILTMEERTNYPFVLSVEDNDRSLGLTAQSVAAVPPERICALMQQAMLSLLAALQQSPETPVHHLNILPPQERRQLLLDANVTPAAADTRCLHQHFEQHAARSPHAVALAWDGGTLTYGELNARANRLAHRLLAEGVQPDQLVALCADRSPQLTIGLLAILKAGAAYLPLDPAYAGERLAYILDDARPALLLADEAGRTALGDTGLNTIALDSTDDDGWPAENPHCAVAPHHLAYVIYTSGSTGQPKGV